MFWTQYCNKQTVTWYRFMPFFIVLFLFVMISSPMAMIKNQQGTMTSCPFSHGVQVMCSMTLADHFSAWNNLWLAVSPSQLLLTLFILLVASIVPTVLLQTDLRRSPVALSQPHLFSYLTPLFARGVLNPKTF